MARRNRWGALPALAGIAIAACSGGGSDRSADPPAPEGPPVTPPPAEPPPVEQPPAAAPPLRIGDWSFYGQEQGLPPAVHDASADDAGNVYVAGYDGLWVKRRDDAAFHRVDADAAGLSKTCYGTTDAEREALRSVPQPTVPPAVCPIISVAGFTAGRAYVGYKGVGTDQDKDANWALWSGGMDVVSFDGEKVSRVRHVLVASPPHVVCEEWLDPPTNSRCAPFDYVWVKGRHKMRQIFRIAVNRKPGIGFGDALMGGSHGTFSVYVANPQQRRWAEFDRTDEGEKVDPRWADARHVWEHEHADSTTAFGIFRSGSTWALAFDPASGVMWGANEFRIAQMPGYASMRHPSATNNWWGPVERSTIWYPEADPRPGGRKDRVQSISFCDDGTMWVASLGNGLGRRSRDGTWSFVSVPGGNGLTSVACDLDGSVWTGSGFDGSIWRLRAGEWTTVPPDAPPFARVGPVRSIQIDRSATPRIVWFSHLPRVDGAAGSQTVTPGGLTAYAGP